MNIIYLPSLITILIYHISQIRNVRIKKLGVKPLSPTATWMRLKKSVRNIAEYVKV